MKTTYFDMDNVKVKARMARDGSISLTFYKDGERVFPEMTHKDMEYWREHALEKFENDEPELEMNCE